MHTTSNYVLVILSTILLLGAVSSKQDTDDVVVNDDILQGYWAFETAGTIHDCYILFNPLKF